MVGIYSTTEVNAPIELVGGKARGLMHLKSLEKKINEEVIGVKSVVPPFIVIPPKLDLSNNSKLKQAINSLDSNLYAVRSSSPLEDEGDHNPTNI